MINDADMRLVWAPPGRDLQPAAFEAARQSDAVVMFLGLSPRLEGEEMKVPVPGFKGGDRIDLGLPAAQQALMEKVVALGKPMVLVLLNGSAVAVELGARSCARAWWMRGIPERRAERRSRTCCSATTTRRDGCR